MTMNAVVIGCGPAGLLGASLLRRRGFEVTVIADGQGTLAMWSGDFSFIRTQGAFNEFPIQRSLTEWLAAFDEVAELFSSFGVALQRFDGKAIAHTVTATGNLRPTFLVPSWQYASLEPEDLIIVGVDGLADSIVEAQAANYRGKTGCRAIEVRLPRPPGWDQSWGALRFASYLDSDAGGAWLCQELIASLRSCPPDLEVVLPQIVGLERTTHLLDRLVEEGQRRMREFSLLSPSVGGVRILDRWKQWLRRQGVHFISGHVVKIAPTATVTTADGRSFAGDYVLLATGGVLGGGFRVTVDGLIIDELVNREVGRMDSVEDLDRVGHDKIDCLGSGRVLAIGRALGGWNPNRDHNGGAMVVGSVRMALGMIEENAHGAL
ncbi:MAG: hypothetical protein MP439_09445 [Ferrimicrobium sp.]|jgi:glycerol-3-phosphate dehydrogenase subunit B|nr:hypothetical protein [Ferrimicrobium sp.]